MSFDRRHMRSSSVMFMVSIALAVGMWYVVCVNDVVEVQLDLRLDYYGIPANLVVTDGLEKRMSVRVRGPQALLRSVTNEYLSKAVDLSSLKPGRNVVPLLKESMSKSFRAFELMDVSPRQIVVQTEPLLERVVPVVAEPYNPLRRGAIEVRECKVSPAVVTLRGPESVISGITEVILPVRVDAQSAGRTEYGNVTLLLPQLVSAKPAEVSVEYTITSERIAISREYPVRLEAVDKEEYILTPEKLSVLIDLPESLSKSPSYMRKLDVFVLPPPLDPGQSVDAVVRYRVPEGMIVQSPPVRTVRVSRKPLPEKPTVGEQHSKEKGVLQQRMHDAAQ